MPSTRLRHPTHWLICAQVPPDPEERGLRPDLLRRRGLLTGQVCRGDQGHDPLPPRRDERRSRGAGLRPRRAAAGEPDVGPLFFEVRAAAGRTSPAVGASAGRRRFGTGARRVARRHAAAAAGPVGGRGPPARSCRVGRRELRAELRAVHRRPRGRRRRRRLRPERLWRRRSETRPVTSYYAPPAPPAGRVLLRRRRRWPARRGRGLVARDGHLAAPRRTSSCSRR